MQTCSNCRWCIDIDTDRASFRRCGNDDSDSFGHDVPDDHFCQEWDEEDGGAHSAVYQLVGEDWRRITKFHRSAATLNDELFQRGFVSEWAFDAPEGAVVASLKPGLKIMERRCPEWKEKSYG